MESIPFYNVGKLKVYHYSRGSTEYTSTLITKEEAESLSSEWDIVPCWRLVYQDNSSQGYRTAHLLHGETNRMNTPDLINQINQRYIAGELPIYVSLDRTYAGALSIHNPNDFRVYFYANTDTCVGFAAPLSCQPLGLGLLHNPLPHKPSCFRIYTFCRGTPILKVEAILQRKNNQGSYTREEYLYPPCGQFNSLEHVKDALNSVIMMRGERNGFIYGFGMKKGRLTLCAPHRQPNDSFIRVLPIPPFVLGVHAPFVLKLVTLAYHRFQEEIDLLWM